MPSPLVCRMIWAPRFARQFSARLGVLFAVPFSFVLFAPAAFASEQLPQGGQFVSGQGSIAGDSHGVLIAQPGSTRGVIDWHSFSIAQGNSVTINNGSGGTLNRVMGGSPSAILGSLSATGSLYLINPQGILIGANGMVSTGGRFVASTLDLPHTAFMNSGTLTLGGNTNARVVNLGKISSHGGDVFLIARDAVVNAGTASAPNGTAEYAVGQQVVSFESSSSRQVFVLTSSKGTVVDRGVTQAAQINLEAADGNINVDGNGSLANGDYGGFSILAGYNDGTIANAHTSGTINSQADINRTTSDLVGENFGMVTRSSSDVIITSEGQVGGLVGFNAPNSIIRQSFSSDNGVDRPWYQAKSVNEFGHGSGGGGFVGNNEGLIAQSYTTSPITFMPNTCGFNGRPCDAGSAALVQRNSGTITQSFATGTVTTSVVPGFGPPALGIASNNDGTIGKDVFWNVDTTHATLGVYSGTGVSAATELTTAQMSTPASFGPTDDFSSTGVWAMPAGATHSVLRWQVAN
jgi:filamentous hemagglutinin family protein